MFGFPAVLGSGSHCTRSHLYGASIARPKEVHQIARLSRQGSLQLHDQLPSSSSQSLGNSRWRRKVLVNSCQVDLLLYPILQPLMITITHGYDWVQQQVHMTADDLGCNAPPTADVTDCVYPGFAKCS